MRRDTVLRRSQLVTPAAKPTVVVKALASGADSVILDLEDAVPADRKAEARSVLAGTLADAAVRVGEVAVRINGLHTDWWLDDMRALCGLPISSIVIPKVRSPSDVVCIDRVAHQLRQHGLAEVSLQPMIETPDAVLQAKAIAAASPCNVALLFGIGDYIAQTGMRFGSTGTDLARAQVALAAHAAGVDPIDHVWPYAKDLEGLERDARAGAALGYAGKWAVHPAQLETLHAAFMPTPAELDEARRIIAAYQASVAEGIGALLVEGQLVDEAVIKIMQGRLRMEMAERT
ncbi:HpcH/HpaI aldolase/citrate lyase family protein [Mesorhizobium sp. 1B3]|uniref:HpcH/HpaI aldolase/citrate lyase family protein n=1 Tax=Mesorhizobium sp. 1B3 TaxID=3243599 RepID=UPI003D97FAC4